MGAHAGARYLAGDTSALCIMALGARYLGLISYAPAGGTNEVIRVRLPWVSVLYHCSEGVRMVCSRRLGNGNKRLSDRIGKCAST